MSSDSIININNLSFYYSDETQALDNISFSIRRYSKTAILGPNGAGKSTLVRMLNGTLRGHGDIKINGQKIDKKNLRELHKKVGVVFQNPDDQLFCPTIYEDVAFGPVNLKLPAAETERRVKESLKKVGLEGFEDRSSFHLSYGERKSASIATVIAMEPEVYVFDEPSANLDPLHRRKIINFIKNLRKTVVIATHDLDLVLDTCDTIVLLNKGRLVRSGGIEILKEKETLESNQLELPLRFQGKRYP